MNADQKNTDSTLPAEIIHCWCGAYMPKGRLHYIVNDPENGPAHQPEAGEQCHNCGGIVDRGTLRHHELTVHGMGVEHEHSHKMHMPEGWCQEPTCNEYVDPESSTEPGRCGDCGLWLHQEEHELALVLNVLYRVGAFVHELPQRLAEDVETLLAEHTGRCLTKHLNDYGQCIVDGCPQFKQPHIPGLHRTQDGECIEPSCEGFGAVYRPEPDDDEVVDFEAGHPVPPLQAKAECTTEGCQFTLTWIFEDLDDAEGRLPSFHGLCRSHVNANDGHMIASTIPDVFYLRKLEGGK